MKYVLIIHEVKDYAAWKIIFDRAAKMRKHAGEISFQVLKYENDTNKVVHFSKWDTHENAKQFFNSPELIEIRKEAGVKSPDFIYLDLQEAGIL